MLVIVIAVTLRGVCDVAALGPRFDEQWIRVPIDGILRDGWSVRTAIDFEETKGPGMIWPYAALGAIVGGTLADLRWITVACFVAGVVPLLLLARRAGVVGAGLVAVAALYCLLPQQLVLGQLVMSEPLFVTTTLFSCSPSSGASSRGAADGPARRRRSTGRATMAGLGVVDGRGAHPVAGLILYGSAPLGALHNCVRMRSPSPRHAASCDARRRPRASAVVAGDGARRIEPRAAQRALGRPRRAWIPRHAPSRRRDAAGAMECRTSSRARAVDRGAPLAGVA
ncbi:MAG: hypothetical protein U0575_07185 [Phycisphaerales bacterium]